MHAGCILPARSSWLVLALRSSFYLLIFSAIPGRGFLLAGGRGNGAGQAAWPRVQVAAVLWLLCQVVADGMTTLSFFSLSFTHLAHCFPLLVFFHHFLKLILHQIAIKHQFFFSFLSIYQSTDLSIYRSIDISIYLSIYLPKFVAVCIFFGWSSFKAAGEWVSCVFNCCALWFDYFSDWFKLTFYTIGCMK